MAFSLNQKTFTFLVASLYLLYGVSKLLFILLVYTIPESLVERIPLLNLFLHKDHTVAGYMYEIVFGIFAIFTILYGFALLYSTNKQKSFLNVFLTPHLETYLMVLLGAFLVIFYILVIKTSLPIPKDPNYMKVYWYMGVGGGLSFIVFPLLFEIVVYMFPMLSKLSLAMKALIILIAVVLIAIIFGILISKFYKPYQEVKEEADSKTLKI